MNAICASSLDFVPAGISFVIAVILIASIWSYLGSLAEHERQRAAVLAGMAYGDGLMFIPKTRCTVSMGSCLPWGRGSFALGVWHAQVAGFQCQTSGFLSRGVLSLQDSLLPVNMSWRLFYAHRTCHMPDATCSLITKPCMQLP